MEIQIRIYNLNGIMVRTLAATYEESLLLSVLPPLSWDGTDSNGKKLSNGIYPYKIIFKGRNGAYSETNQKLVILR